MPAPVLKEIVRQHAEHAAFLWAIYDRHKLFPEENPDMDEERLARLIELLEAHLDGLRVAGAAGLEIAKALLRENGEDGELFVLRMLQPEARSLRIVDLNLDRVRQFLASPAARKEALA